MIQINRILEQKVELFNPTGGFMGFVNKLELNDVRIQIAKAKEPGYYIVFFDKRIDIDTNGDLSCWPLGFFDVEDVQLATLYKIRTGKIK